MLRYPTAGGLCNEALGQESWLPALCGKYSCPHPLHQNINIEKTTVGWLYKFYWVIVQIFSAVLLVIYDAFTAQDLSWYDWICLYLVLSIYIFTEKCDTTAYWLAARPSSTAEGVVIMEKMLMEDTRRQVRRRKNRLTATDELQAFSTACYSTPELNLKGKSSTVPYPITVLNKPCRYLCSVDEMRLQEMVL